MNLLDLHNRGIDNLKRHSNWGNSVICRIVLDHEDLPLQHERDVDELKKSFWTKTDMMQSIMRLRTRVEKTARGALSPAIPALYVPLPSA